ncbi:hypothetical protein AAG906_006848 [Vitis piasezkii]
MMTTDRATCIMFSVDDLPPEGSPYSLIVLLDNGSPKCLPISYSVAPALHPQILVLRIPTSFNLLLGRPWFHGAGAIPSSLHQKISHNDDDIFLIGFTFDEVQTLEIQEFCRDFVAMSFDQHSSTPILDMMRDMSFIPSFGLRRHQHGSSELVTTIYHDTPFGLGFTPSENDVRYMTRLHRNRVRTRLFGIPFDYPVHPYTFSLADYFVRGSEVQPHVEEIGVEDSTVDELQHMLHQIFMMITLPSPDRANLFFLCFPDETIDYGIVIEPTDMIDGAVPHDEYHDEMDMLGINQFLDAVQHEPFSPLELFRVSVIEIVEEDQTVPAPELPAFVVPTIDMYEGTIDPIEGAPDFVDPPLLVDILSGLVTRSDYVSDDPMFDINDEIAQPDLDKASFDHDFDPIDERVSPAIGNDETVDFGTDDQPRELKIGLPLSIDERNRLIHLLKSYLDVKEEIKKQHSVGFISMVEYPKWLANVVPIPKKDSKVRVYVDFRDLNKASPKYDFHLLHIDLLVDSTACHSILGLLLFFFHDMMYRDVEVYVDDMIVKSRGRVDHLAALERFFERIQKFRLRLNPKKCTFGVTYGKLLGHMVNERGIEVDPDKIKAILDMPVPRIETRSRVFGKNQPIDWNDDCQLAFEMIKEYLLSPPVLVPPMPGCPLLLYLLVSDMALGLLVWATRRLRHYMKEYSVHLSSCLDPLRYLFNRPALANHLASLTTIESRPVDDDFPDEEFVAMTRLSGWRMYFDGAANHSGYGIDAAKDRRALRQLATRFVICGETLYRRSIDGMLLLCLDRTSADRVMREVHAGVCGLHMGGHMLTHKIMRILLMHVLTSPWSFSYGVLISLENLLKSSNGHEFILLAIDYFTKWVEATSYAKLTFTRVSSFIRSHIIYRYGVPHELISDRKAHFKAEVETLLLSMASNITDHRIQPQTNGAVKNIKKILRKMVETSQDWSYTLLPGIWYGGCFASRDRDGFFKSSS